MSAQQFPPGLARAMGRGDLARPEVRIDGTGQGAAYFGKGSTSTGPMGNANGTAVGIRQSANVGSTVLSGALTLDTGVSAFALIGGLVVALVVFNWWTAGHRA